MKHSFHQAPRTILELDEMISALSSSQPDYDICSECGEHADFDGELDSHRHAVSDCCGARAYDTDPDIDMER